MTTPETPKAGTEALRERVEQLMRGFEPWPENAHPTFSKGDWREVKSCLSAVVAYLSQPEQPALGAEPVDGSYYAEGKDCPWFEGLSDKDFALEATKAAQDLADMDIGEVEKYIPIVGIIGDAADRIARLAAPSPDVAALQAENERLKDAELQFKHVLDVEKEERQLAAGRAEAAEALVADMREALEPFSKEWKPGQPRVSKHHFDTAREVFSRLEGSRK